jgi:hypothetical protein
MKCFVISVRATSKASRYRGRGGVGTGWINRFLRGKGLPAEIRRAADKQFVLWLNNPRHRSLRFKQIRPNLWSARVTDEAASHREKFAIGSGLTNC